MDQELLNVIIESLRTISKESLLDQAFLQVGFLRKNGYDVVSKNHLKSLQTENQALLQEIKAAQAAFKQWRELIQQQQERIIVLEEENNYLKGLK